MLPPIDWHMCAREASTTPDSARLQTFRHLGDCLRSDSSCCKSRHTCCSPASCIWMAYSYKASTARNYLKYLSCMRQSPIICTHALPSCHLDLSTYNNLTLPHLGLFAGVPMPRLRKNNRSRGLTTRRRAASMVKFLCFQTRLEGVWGPPGGLGTSVGKKYFAYPSVFGCLGGQEGIGSEK